MTRIPVLLLLLATFATGQDQDPAAAADNGEQRERAEQQDRVVPKSEGYSKPDALGWAIDGYLLADTRYRHVESEDDLDLYLHAYVDAIKRTDEDGAWRALFNGRAIWDIVGDSQPNDFLYEFWDTFNGDLQFRLYEASVQGLDLFDKKLNFIVGRQFLDEDTYFHVDGARVDFKLGGGGEITVIGGVPVRLSGTSTNDNWMVGLLFKAPIGRRTRVRFSYYHVDEFFPGINDPVVDPQNQPVSIPAQQLRDDYFGATIWHRFYQNLRAFGRFSLLNGRANELQLRLRWFTPDGKWTVFGEWYQLFERLNNVTNDLTPYVPMLGSYYPFFRLTVRGTYQPSEEWLLTLAGAWRQLEDESNEGQFNHTYYNYAFTISRTGLLDDKLDLTLAGVGYTSTQDNDVYATTFSATYWITKELELSGGIDYSLYKYVWFNNSERENVYTYWFRTRWRPDKTWRVVGGISVDDDRFATYLTVFVRATMRF
jgi:hypothetical protein